jgi:hypothetical protein
MLTAALDFRHHSIDGRLVYWTSGLVEEFLLTHAPRRLSITARDAVGLPENLRVLLAYLHATALADPTGDPSTSLDAAITKASAEFPAAMADEHNFGRAKFWVMTATRHGVDTADGPAMNSFLDRARAGRVDYDHDVLAHVMTRHAEMGGGALVDWVGDGRALTAKGDTKLADARESVTLLDTGDIVDPQIGEQVSAPRAAPNFPISAC